MKRVEKDPEKTGSDLSSEALSSEASAKAGYAENELAYLRTLLDVREAKRNADKKQHRQPVARDKNGGTSTSDEKK